MAADFRFELGTTWLNLQSTISGRRRERTVDLLDSPARLGEWLDTAGLAPGRKPDEADLARARELRDALYAITRACVNGVAPPLPAVRVLSDVVSEDRAPRLSVTGHRLAAARPRDTRQALARIARQASDALSGPNPPRLHACSDETCAGIFLDDSGRRRWCSDTRCGSRARVSAHRARLRR